jgi:hypothetical protein
MRATAYKYKGRGFLSESPEMIYLLCYSITPIYFKIISVKTRCLIWNELDLLFQQWQFKV